MLCWTIEERALRGHGGLTVRGTHAQGHKGEAARGKENLIFTLVRALSLWDRPLSLLKIQIYSSLFTLSSTSTAVAGPNASIRSVKSLLKKPLMISLPFFLRVSRLISCLLRLDRTTPSMELHSFEAIQPPFSLSFCTSS